MREPTPLIIRKHLPALGLMAIVLLACLLRFAHLSISEFKYDEAGTITEARDISLGRSFPLAGLDCSVGLPDGPLMLYLVAIPTLLSSDPTLAVAFVASLSAAAVLATYLFVAKYFDTRTALVASLLLAVNPWATLFGRKVWQENLPLLSVMIFSSIFLLVVSRRQWASVPFFFFLGLQILIKIRAIMYLPATLLTLLLFHRRLKRRPLLSGLSLFALLLSPYLSHLWVHRNEVWTDISQGPLANRPVIDLQALKFSLWLASGYNVEAVLGPAAPLFTPFSQLLSLNLYGITFLMLLGVSLCAWTVYRRREGYERYALLLIWYFVPLLPYIWHTAPVHLGYMLSLFPLPFIFVGLALTTGFQGSRRLLAVVSLVILVTLVGGQGSSTWFLHQYAERYGAGGGFGTPLKYWLEIAKRTKEFAGSLGVDEVIVLAKGSDPRYEGEPAALAYLLEPELRPRFLRRDTQRYLLYSLEGRTLYLMTIKDDMIDETLRQWGRELTSISIPSGDPARLYAIDGKSVRQMMNRLENPRDVPFSNGVHFLGYRAPSTVCPGEELTLLTYWGFISVGEEERAHIYQAFNHFVDVEGKRWAQDDGFGPLSPDWRNGELLLQWFEISVPPETPPGEYWILTGLYLLYDGDRAAVLDEAGHVSGDFIALGPFEVLRKRSTDGCGIESTPSPVL